MTCIKIWKLFYITEFVSQTYNDLQRPNRNYRHIYKAYTCIYQSFRYVKRMSENDNFYT